MKTMLKKIPFIYSLLQRVYYCMIYVLERIIGTSFQEWRWRIRHRIKKDWAKGYIHSASHPHRRYLIEKIVVHTPFGSVLEIGCNVGTNLALLSRRFPASTYYGIDINKDAIAKGKAWLAEQEISNIELSIGKADDLKRFANRGIDIIFTDATLLYIGPDKIRTVFTELLRVCNKTIILLEFHSSLSKGYQYYDARWIYDFARLVREYAPGAGWKISKLPVDGWDDTLWREYGSFIEIIPSR